MMTKAIKKQDLSTLDLAELPDGVNVVYENDKAVAVVMSLKYYSKLNSLIKTVKSLMEKKDEC